MATDAASSETTATAKVVRATERQVRLKLGKALGDREVTKRVAVPDAVRDTIEGAVVPIVVTGSGDKAKVELAEDWLTALADKPKKASGGRKRGAEPAEKPAAEKVADAPKTRTRGGKATKADAKTTDTADKPKTRTRGAKATADATVDADAPKASARKAKAADADAPKTRTRKPKADSAPAGEESASAERAETSSRGKRRGAKAAPEAEVTEAPAPRSRRKPAEKKAAPVIPAPSPALIRSQIAAAVALVRGARR